MNMATVGEPMLNPQRIHPQRINLLADTIENAGQGFDMREWLSLERPNHWDHQDPVGSAQNCGAVACAAGWAVMLFDPGFIYTMRPINEASPSIQGRAAELLGLNSDQARALFLPAHGTTMRDELMCEYEDVTPEDIAVTLRHLATTGRVRWWAQPKRQHCVDGASEN